jgi:hypothetical protein
LEHYASNRYHETHLGYGHHQIFLKFTEVNAALVCDLEDYPTICDSYYYDWQQKHSKEYFNDSDISYYPVIEQALNRLHEDTDWTVSDRIYGAILHFSDLWCGGESYHWSGSSYYFTLQDSNYASDDNINEVVLYFIDNPPYSKKDLNPNTIDNIIQNVTPGIYTLVATSYNDLELHGGGIDYMTTHDYPMQEITIYDGDDIKSIIQDAYNEIVEYNFEYLDYAPI